MRLERAADRVDRRPVASLREVRDRLERQHVRTLGAWTRRAASTRSGPSTIQRGSRGRGDSALRARARARPSGRGRSRGTAPARELAPQRGTRSATRSPFSTTRVARFPDHAALRLFRALRARERGSRPRSARRHAATSRGRASTRPTSRRYSRSLRRTRRTSSASRRPRRPFLRVADARASTEWYARLGFGIDFDHRFEPGLPLFVSRAPRRGSALPLGARGRRSANALSTSRSTTSTESAPRSASTPETSPWQMRERSSSIPTGTVSESARPRDEAVLRPPRARVRRLVPRPGALRRHARRARVEDRARVPLRSHRRPAARAHARRCVRHRLPDATPRGRGRRARCEPGDARGGESAGAERGARSGRGAFTPVFRCGVRPRLHGPLLRPSRRGRAARLPR